MIKHNFFLHFSPIKKLDENQLIILFFDFQTNFIRK